MKKVLALLFLILFCPNSLFAGDFKEILVIGDTLYKPYEMSLAGFQKSCKHKVNFVNIHGLRKKDVLRKIYQEKPDLVLAIGGESLRKVIDLKGIPVFSLMALPQRTFLKYQQISGISIEISPLLQLRTMVKTFPDIKNVGILYDPRNSQYFVDAAAEAAAELGLTLVPLIVDNPTQVPSALEQIKNKVEIIWMIPDPTIVTSETIEVFFLFSLSNKLPVMAFSEKYTEMGAALAVTANTEETGRQAGHMVNRMLEDVDASSPSIYTENAITTLNLRVIKQLEINVNIDDKKAEVDK